MDIYGYILHITENVGQNHEKSNFGDENKLCAPDIQTNAFL